MSGLDDVSLLEILATLSLVVLAIGVSALRRAGLVGGLAEAAIRSFLQLSIVGLILSAVLESGWLLVAIGVLALIVAAAALTARMRARRVPGALRPLLVGLAAAAAVPLAVSVAAGLFPATPRYLIPVGAMMTGASMTAAAVALNRLGDEVAARAGDIEAALALGATAGAAVRPALRASLRSGLIPLIDSTKTAGLVVFPGVLVGSLLAGAEATTAVRLQLVLLWMLLGGVALATLISASLAARAFFTRAHQLVEPPEPPARASVLGSPLRWRSRFRLARK